MAMSEKMVCSILRLSLKTQRLIAFLTRAWRDQTRRALHHMHVRVTVCENFEVKAAEAVTYAGPYHECPQGAMH